MNWKKEKMKINNKKNNMMIDFYELTMGQAYFNEGVKDTRVCFDCFFRKNRDKAAFSLLGNTESIINFIKDFKFSKEEIDYLRSLHIFSEDYLNYLSTMKFTGDVYAVEDGSVTLPNEPDITIVAPIIEAQVIETKLLTLFNFSSLITSKASRIVRAAEGHTVMEFGSRRAHGDAAANLGALDAYVAGAAGTACTMTGMEFGVPVLGTMAHSFIQMFDSEYEAFKAYAKAFPNNATFLVDTYDTLGSGIPNAIKVTKEVLEPMGKTLAGIRIDSGDLAYLSKQARKMLDKAGLKDAKICISNSLDEYLIQDLLDQGAPIDSFGVGENLITAKSDPVFGGVYKLVAVEKDGKWIPKIKISDDIDKITNPGFKDIVRLYDKDGKMITDLVQMFDEPLPSGEIKLRDPKSTWRYTTLRDYTPVRIKKKMIENGEIIHKFKTLEGKRQHLQDELDTLKEENLRLTNAQTIQISLSPKLASIKEKLLEEHNRGRRHDSGNEIIDLDFDEDFKG